MRVWSQQKLAVKVERVIFATVSDLCHAKRIAKMQRYSYVAHVQLSQR